MRMKSERRKDHGKQLERERERDREREHGPLEIIPERVRKDEREKPRE